MALFGHGAWAMLERDGRPNVLARMAACHYDDLGPGFFVLEYDGNGRIVGAVTGSATVPVIGLCAKVANSRLLRRSSDMSYPQLSHLLWGLAITTFQG